MCSKKQIEPAYLSVRLRKEIKIKGERIKWSKTKNGRHVDRILKNVARNTRENARTYRITAVGQWEWPAVDQEDEGLVWALQQLMMIMNLTYILIQTWVLSVCQYSISFDYNEFPCWSRAHKILNLSDEWK